MSAQLEPRVRFQAQWLHPAHNEWWDTSGRADGIMEARKWLRDSGHTKKQKTRIVKETTTFEVVEEMEPKQ